MSENKFGTAEAASVLILDGKALFEKIKPQIEEDDSAPFVIHLGKPNGEDLQSAACECDPYLYHTLILSRTELEESDFLYELRLAKKEALPKAASENPTWYEFVYVSFDSFLSGSDSGKGKEKETEKQEQETDKKLDKPTCMEQLFRRGFRLAGEDSPVLVPFDKSASMARKSRISFLSEEIAPAMNRRIDMDLFSYDDSVKSDNSDDSDMGDDDKCSHVLSKYYAYRALSMSGGHRIDRSVLELNQNTVVVIDVPAAKEETTGLDAENRPMVFTGSTENGSNKLNFSVKRDDSKPVSFDGEGMISFAAADAISAALGFQKDLPSSFQIRMPFAKGMLHKLDFRRFCIEEYGISEESYDNGTATIKDYFGIERKVKDIAIVMTDTMFKEARYMKNRYEVEKKAGGAVLFGDDPMAYYFDSFRKYDRALYVLRTNKSLSDRRHVMLSYQFLATSCLSNEDLRELIRKSLKDTTLPLVLQDPKYDQNKIAYLTQGSADSLIEAEDEEEDAEDLDQNEEDSQLDGLRTRYAKAVKKNPALINDKSIREELRREAYGRVLRAAWKGQIDVSGLNLFLSDDLLFLMSAFAENILTVWEEKKGRNKTQEMDDRTKKNPFWRFAYRHALHRLGRFYAPAVNEGFLSNRDRDRSFAVLRSPHLSRNEQCAMMAYFTRYPEDLYQKYCGQLTGVIMLPWKNRIADRMGGADYDGDIVKVIADEKIEKSARECMKSPTVVISHVPSARGPIPTRVRYEDVRNSLGSHVGLFSNAALRLSTLQYSGKMKEALDLIGKDKDLLNLPLDPEGQPDFAAACCILVGLEVDRAKTGIELDNTVIEIGNKAVKAYRDQQKDRELAHSCGARSNYKASKLGPVILDEREALQNIDLGHRIDEDPSGCLTCTFNFQSLGEIKLQKPQEGDAILDRLPYEVLSAWKQLQEENREDRENQENEKTVRTPSVRLWRDKAEGPLLEPVEALFLAAKDVSGKIQLIRSVQREYEDISDPFFHSAVRYLIMQGETGGDAYRDATLLRDMIHAALEDPVRSERLLSLIEDRNWSAKGPCQERARELEKYLIPEGLQEDKRREWHQLLPKLFAFSSWGFLILPYLISSERIVDGKSIRDLFDVLQESTRTAIRKLTLPDKGKKEPEDEDDTDGTEEGEQENTKKNSNRKKTSLSDEFLIKYGTSSDSEIRDLQQNGKALAAELAPDEKAKRKKLSPDDLSAWIEGCTCKTSWDELNALTSCDPFFSLTAKTAEYREKFRKELEPSLIYRTSEEHADACDRPPEELWTLVREELKQLFNIKNEDLTAAIPYWAACRSKVDPSHKILWNVFTPDEICRAGGSNHAE